MLRTQLSDQLWSKFNQILISYGVYNKIRLRFTVEGILYKLRTGCPWRDVPFQFGNWNAIFKRFNEWSLHGKLKSIFFLLSKYHDNEWTFIDGSVVKAHQHSSGAAYGAEAAIGKSVAGNSTKIHLAVDAMGFPICFTITGGEVHDSKEAQNLINHVPELEILIADATRYDKLKRNYEGMLYLACSIIWLPM